MKDGEERYRERLTEAQQALNLAFIHSPNQLEDRVIRHCYNLISDLITATRLPWEQRTELTPLI